MQVGVAMIRWAEESQTRQARRQQVRQERSAASYRIARQQAEAARESAAQRASMMFWGTR